MSTLVKCESVIRKSEQSFFAKCAAFKEIEERELWNGKYKSFPQYCIDRWEFTPSQVSRFIAAAEVMERLSECEAKPKNEGQARVLTKVPAETQKEIWEEVILQSKEQNVRITAKLIEEVAGLNKSTDANSNEEVPKSILSFVAIVESLTTLRQKQEEEDFEVDLKMIQDARKLLDEMEQKAKAK